MTALRVTAAEARRLGVKARAGPKTGTGGAPVGQTPPGASQGHRRRSAKSLAPTVAKRNTDQADLLLWALQVEGVEIRPWTLEQHYTVVRLTKPPAGLVLVAEHRFAPPRRWRFDWAFPGQKVAVEVDGGNFKWGGGRHGSDADREKGNFAAAMGWRCLHFSPRQLRSDPAARVALVRRALEGR